jgi:tetratricopeptide (TPR) repeat protein
VNRLEQELGNLRAALAWWLERGEAEQGLRLGTAISYFFYVRGYLSEGREWLARLLAMTGPAASTAPQTLVRAKALDAAGSLALFQQDYAAVRAFIEENLALKRELGDERGVARSLYDLAMVAQYQGDYRHAEVLLEQGLAIGRSLEDAEVVATSLMQRGVIAHRQGDYTTARLHLEESVTVWRTSNNRRGLGRLLSALGSLALAEGDYVTARARFKESLAIWGGTGDRGGIALLLAGFAELAIAEAQPRRALRLAGAAAALREKHGTPLAPSLWVRLERILELARSAFRGEDDAIAWSERQAMTLEQASAYALAVE